MSAKIHQFIRRVSTLAAALLICFCTISKPFFAQPAEAAYHQTYIQTTIDTSNWDILAGVVDLKTGFLEAPLEYSRVGGDVLGDLAGTNTPSAAANLIDSDPNGGGGDKAKNLVLTFPGNTKPEGGLIHAESTDKDSARAGLILNSLLFDMNAAFKFVYGDDYVPDGADMDAKLGSYRNDLKNFLNAVPGGSCNGASFASGANGVSSFVDDTVSAEDYVTITKGGESRFFQYRMIKGYDSGHASSLGLVTCSGDAKYVHWGHFAVEAFMNYTSDDKYKVTADEVYNGTPGALEKGLAAVLDSICNFIANSLGLWNFDQLVFNSGLRGTSAYAAGVFPSSWQSYIWTFFFVAELVAIGMLLYAIIFNVGRRALSTVNPVARASAISQIEALFFVAIALGLLPVAIQLLMGVSFNLTGMFQDILGTDVTAQQRFNVLTSGSGALGAIITRIIYLGAIIYFNFFYGIRALAIAILIITAPLFIACIGISEKKRMLAETWAREFAANLFIQPLQAMMLSFILLLPSTGRTFDAIVLAYAMIPLTHMVRGQFFGGAGSFAHQLADRGRMKAMQTMGRGATLAGGVALGAAGGAIGAATTAFGHGGGAQSGSSGESPASGNNNATSPPPPSFTPPPTEGAAPPSRQQRPLDTPSDSAQQRQGGSSQQPATTAERVAQAVGRLVGRQQPVVAGTDTGSTQRSNSVADGIREGETVDPGKDDKPVESSGDSAASDSGRPGMGKAAAAIALGALGGATDQINRRVFGVQSRGGGVLTQLSRNMATSANKTLHPSESPMTGTGDAEESSSPAYTQDDFKSYIPTEESYSENQDDGNAYASGSASMVGGGDGATFQIGKDDMKDAGVRVGSNKDEGTSTVSYDLSKLSKGDANRALEMAAIYTNGTDEERAQMEQTGIESIALRTKMVDGQETVTGVDMTVNPETLKENFGIDTQPASMGGKGMEISAPAGSRAPQLVPDVAQHLTNVPAKAFSSSIQSMGGSVTPQEGGQTQVSVPEAQLPQFKQMYPSVDTSTATTENNMTTFSVPSSSILEGATPQSPVVREISQRRHIDMAPPPAAASAPPAPPADNSMPPVSNPMPPIDNPAPASPPMSGLAPAGPPISNPMSPIEPPAGSPPPPTTPASDPKPPAAHRTAPARPSEAPPAESGKRDPERRDFR